MGSNICRPRVRAPVRFKIGRALVPAYSRGRRDSTVKRCLSLALALAAILAAVAVVSVRHIAADHAPSSYGARSSPKGQGAGKKYAERLDPFLAKAMREDNIPGFAIGVVEDGQLVYSRGLGVMKVGDPSHPVTEETLFHMA